jgi:hypothetical protein
MHDPATLEAFDGVVFGPLLFEVFECHPSDPENLLTEFVIAAINSDHYDFFMPLGSVGVSTQVKGPGAVFAADSHFAEESQTASELLVHGGMNEPIIFRKFRFR